MMHRERLLLDKLEQGFKDNRIIIIVGSRQVGKTTLMNIYKDKIPEDYRCFYFNLEDINSLSICQDIDSLRLYLKDNGVDIKSDKIFLIIDEFHYIKNATKLFKIIYDLYPEVKILASGSSSIEIQKHLQESLAGRKRVYHLYPLSFEEFIRFRNEQEYERYGRLGFESISTVSAEIYNRDYLKDYLLFGGYPKIALLDNKTEKIEEIEDIYNSYIQKDIKSLIKGEDIWAYNNLLKVLSSQIGNLLNINELSNTLNLNRRLVIKYLNVLEQTFIIKLLSPFSHNKRVEISKMPKIYLLDSGMVNFSLGNFGQIDYRPNLGGYIENFVFCEIIRYKPIYYHVYFWRTKIGTEIDFVLEGNNELIPIEVKWQKNTSMIACKSFISFFKTYKNIKKAVIVTMDTSGKIQWEDKEICFVPAVLFNKYMTKMEVI
jgi:predicted AAA+ superfamily ATPase